MILDFLLISDMPIFFNTFWPIADANTDTFPIVWKQHQVRNDKLIIFYSKRVVNIHKIFKSS